MSFLFLDPSVSLISKITALACIRDKLQMLSSDPAGGEKDDFVLRRKQSCCSSGSRVFLFILISHLEWSFTHCTHLGSGMMVICSQLHVSRLFSIFNIVYVRDYDKAQRFRDTNTIVQGQLREIRDLLPEKYLGWALSQLLPLSGNSFL